MHNVFLVYSVNLYVFWAYLGPSSGGTTDSHPKKNNKYELLYTYGCASWWWA